MGIELISRVILQPRGGGEPLQMFDSGETADVEADTILAVYTDRFGEPVDVALTELPGVGAVQIGWVFEVPGRMVLPGPHEQFEMVVITMVPDPEGGSPVSLFARLAEQRIEFQELFDSGDVDELHHVTLAHRNPDETPIVETDVQRRKAD